jgi:Holliday junction resolvase-like predicted endonuclease
VKIELHQVPVRDLVDAYVNSGYDGVVGYGGVLDIRPKFQREFVYDAAQQRAVITTILAGFPLNVMYWSSETDPNTGQVSYEMLDGQQRSMSICEYVAGEFSAMIGGNPKNFDNLSKDDQDRILDYELMVYFCAGSEDAKLAWFEGELDVVARDSTVIVFVEVKTRSGTAFGEPSEAVGPVKARRIRGLALRWLAEHRPAGAGELRFDVVSIVRRHGSLPVVQHLRGAF